MKKEKIKLELHRLDSEISHLIGLCNITNNERNLSLILLTVLVDHISKIQAEFFGIEEISKTLEDIKTLATKYYNEKINPF